MKKRFTGGILVVLLLCGFYWYYHSHNTETVTAFYNLSLANHEVYSDNMVEFTYPANWQVEQQQVTGDEILHHVSYRETNQQVMGYVQVWTAIKPLQEFLKESRNSPAADADIEHFSMRKIKEDQYQGYLLSYERKGLQNSFTAREYFFEKNKRIYRISLFVDKDIWSDDYQKVFDQLISSFNVLS